jgi:NADPH:quinone reductase-like Zn-dependent oxidoreductase
MPLKPKLSTMAKSFPPKTMRAWQYSSTKGGIEKNLRLNSNIPTPIPKANQHLVQILACALNPVDYKIPEIGLVSRFVINKPAIPCVDFSGAIVTPAPGSDLKPGQLVFGIPSKHPLESGAMGEYLAASADNVVALPEGVKPVDAAGVVVAGVTAYQSIIPRVKKGDSIFINGGSGGTGCFGIQMAKIAGCHVTTTCSSRNIELCKSLGADEVIDYTKGSVRDILKKGERRFDHAVDNVGTNEDLVWYCHEFMKPGAVFVKVAGTLTVGGMLKGGLGKRLPATLGGIKGTVEGFWPQVNVEELKTIVGWMAEGKLRATNDTVFAYEEGNKAFEKLKSGRARGKVVVDVALETYKEAWGEKA